jgi:hypothetical protein
VNGRVDGRIPGNHLIQMAITLFGRLPRIERPLQVAAIDHRSPAALQFRGEVGHPQCLRPHRGATMAGADIGGNADQ